MPADDALAAARAAEVEIATGGHRGPLHGIPIGLKDIYDTAGVATEGAFSPQRNRWFADSLLEGGGFEPSVPRRRPSPPWPLNLLQP